ncbi:SIMPL domain-containing protein [Aquincola sp. S2]|uniref:SIMPL domain-containing protein n=1 Tax=Pseudaquabacterium terrae TaxID=2732868 RepID=A0ABX2EPL9_9BURK|nr:SIMPL domain-containing protein [Aquabacterium terrae]NRF70528.1 SIMPL domain-containing protein [Aquabacterium terrae]
MSVRSLIAVAALACAAAANAQQQVLVPPPQNVLSLAAQASAEVPQDLLSITLAVTREGADAAAVQSQLRQVLDAALNEARKAARPGQLDVRTGQFSLSPRYTNKGVLSGWSGRAELVLEGRDSGAISQLAGRLNGMPVAHVAHGLSREQREKAEAEVAAQAIQRFRQRAEEYARHFGFAGYSIREVNVGQADGIPPPQPMFRRAMMAQAGAVADESVPVEAGKATVTVTVSGSVQMSAR